MKKYYWFYKENCFYEEWALDLIQDITRLDFKVEVEEEVYNTLKEKAEKEHKLIVNNPKDNLPMLIDYPPPSSLELAQRTIRENKEELDALDYMTIRFAERLFKTLDLSKYPELQKEKDMLMDIWKAKEEARNKINELEVQIVALEGDEGV